MINNKKVKISSSMMCADFLNMQNDINIFNKTKIDYLHIDIMDGHYVPNFTLGIAFCSTLSASSEIPLDIHLMIEDVDRYIPEFAKFPKAIVCIHPEVSYHPIRSLQLIKSFGAKAGIAIDPAISIESLKYMLPDIDMVCIMTVNPGYAGQKIVAQTLDKIKELSNFLNDHNYNIEIEVDGNVSWANMPKMIEAGADILVAGSSSLFDKQKSLEENILKMRALIAEFNFAETKI